MADEEEAGTFEILAWHFQQVFSRRKARKSNLETTRAYKVQDNRHAVVSLPASKTLTS